MNLLNKSIVAAACVFSLSAPMVIADTIDNAFKFCGALDRTGLLSEPCKVSGWNQSIDVKMDTSSSEARKICYGIVGQASKSRMHFDKGWKVRIYSPYSNDNTIAQCSF